MGKLYSFFPTQHLNSPITSSIFLRRLSFFLVYSLCRRSSLSMRSRRCSSAVRSSCSNSLLIISKYLSGDAYMIASELGSFIFIHQTKPCLACQGLNYKIFIEFCILLYFFFFLVPFITLQIRHTHHVWLIFNSSFGMHMYYQNQRNSGVGSKHDSVVFTLNNNSVGLGIWTFKHNRKQAWPQMYSMKEYFLD